MENLRKTVEGWNLAFEKGTDFDLWGQPVEAIECYKRLSRELSIAVVASDVGLTPEQKTVCSRLINCLDLRIKCLRMPEEEEHFTLEKLRQSAPALANLMKNQKTSLLEHNFSHINSSQFDDREDSDIIDVFSANTGTLLPPPKLEAGKTYVTVRIEKIGLKDAQLCIDPFITVSVKDVSGVDLTPVQNTPVMSKIEDNYIYFNLDVEIQKPVEYLPNGYGIFFEFKHFKPKKKIISTKCFALLEKDEVKAGPIALELYKKPTDFTRRRLNLLTVKPLYLHLYVTLNST